MVSILKPRIGLQIGLIIVSLPFMGMAGCAGSGFGTNSVESQKAEVQDKVSGLAAARWQALIQGDVAKAYEYLSPGTRSVMSLATYRTKIRPGLWKKEKVDSVSCKLEECEVKMIIEYSYRNIKSIEYRESEIWLKEGDQWWYVPHR